MSQYFVTSIVLVNIILAILLGQFITAATAFKLDQV